MYLIATINGTSITFSDVSFVFFSRESPTFVMLYT